MYAAMRHKSRPLFYFKLVRRKSGRFAKTSNYCIANFIRFLGRAMLSTLHDTLRLIVTGIYARRDGKIFAAPHARTPSKPTKAEKFGTSI